MQLNEDGLIAATQAIIGTTQGQRFGVAVSGGPDSMALLALAARAFVGQVAAVTMDHGLRTASADEAAMVAGWCATQAIPHAIVQPDAPVSGNVQSWARAQRYAAIERWRVAQGIDWIMTAHHADDQLETMLMRLNRGSGVAGLAGVRAWSGRVIRPLLAVRKADLLAFARHEALPYADDPSNSDPRFDRASLRTALADVDWLDAIAAGRSAAALAEAEAALGWSVGELVAHHVRAGENGVTLDRTDLPREYLRRLVLAMLAQVGADIMPRGDTIDRAIATAQAGGQASLGDWLLAGGVIWRLYRAPCRRSNRP